MPFDPTRPRPQTEIDADELRAQFNGLRDELNARIDAIPAGPPGPPGADGADGAAGEQGPPGEISLAQLNEALAGTARNPIGLPSLDTPYSDPASEELRQFCNTLRDLILRPPT